MKKYILTITLLLLAAPLAAGVTNNGDGTSTLWFCSPNSNVTALNDAITSFSNDEASAFHALATLVLLDQSVITVGNGATDTTYCGVLAAGRSEWRVTVSNAVAGPFQTAMTDRMGYVDLNPNDGVDDNTGETRQQMLDRGLKEGLKSFVQRKHNIDHGPPTQADDFDDDPT